jgi:hypothetical protein
VISALVAAAFSGSARTPEERSLAGVVQTEVAERLMVLAANSDASAEVRAFALAGVHEIQSVVKKAAVRGPGVEQLDHEITLFLQNPQQNTPRLKSAGVPAGPPV